MTLCYLGMGSNLRSPERQLRQALLKLQKLPKTVLTKRSKLYVSKASGLKMQPQYCNMVIEVHTTLSASKLLSYCQHIESQHQRIRKKHWGSRTLDIDLLLFGKQIIKHPKLTIPHPEMTKRDFVLLPLLNINPEAQLPNGDMLNPYLEYCSSYIQRKTR